MGALERALHTQVSRYLVQTIPRRQSHFHSFTHSDLFNLPLPALWTVVLGENNRKVESGYEQRIPVDKIIMHEKYRHFKNDLGEFFGRLVGRAALSGEWNCNCPVCSCFQSS
jgi:hypothetical protein